MPFYTGKSKDGSDMQEVPGMYINPNNPDEWSSQPYPEQRKEMRTWETIKEYSDGRYTISDIRNQVLNKSCPLPRSIRDYILNLYDEDGNFKE